MDIKEWLGEENTLGIDIWKRKYQKNGESFDQWLDRITNGNEDLKKLIIEKKFLFGGRILSNRGLTGSRVTYSNCYVITPPEDNIESIYDCRKKLARTFSAGGGCGIDMSKLAPAGATVRNQAEKTTGAVSFIEGFSKTTEEIGQNGRRGALMVSLECHHPDLPEFIDLKTTENAVTKANISVRVTDDFMEAVRDDEDWVMSFTRPETGETIERKMRAKELFHKLCQNNYDWAEPGILYWDTISNWNLLSNYEDFEYAGVNPCAEEPLPAGGSCLLGSINLSEFVTDKGEVDRDGLFSAVRIAVRGLNEVLDEGLELHPLEEQRESVKKWRQIGLGIMGVADMLIKLKLPYDSKEAITLCSVLSKFIANAAMTESAILAKQKGTFPEYSWDKIRNSNFFAIASDKTREWIKKFGLRNSQLLTIAPTGTISTMLGISGGVEPIFANSYNRKTESLHGKEVYYKVYTPIAEKYMKEHGLTEEEQLPKWFVTSATIDPLKRIDMQAAWQTGVDASISSTVNLPQSATVEEIEELYMTAWEKGLKGLTIFRAGCKRAPILDSSKKKEEETEEKLERGQIVECSENLIGMKRKLQTGCGTLHCLAYFDSDTGAMQEVYLAKGSTGGCANFMVGLSRMISLALRGGVSVYDIKDQLDSTGACPSYATRSATKHDTSKGACCPMAVGNALVSMHKEMQERLGKVTKKPIKKVKIDKKPEKPQVALDDMTYCPECGDKTVREGGCIICKSCGWSKCN